LLLRIKELGSNRLKTTGTCLTIFAAYVALACITTWPLAARITDHLPGQSSDRFLHYWNGWWVQKAIATSQSPLYTPLIFHPRGVSLITHNIAWMNVLPWLVLEPMFGGITAYNLILLLNLSLGGFTAFLLTKHLTGDTLSAFVAGFVYQAWPFRLSQLDHPNLFMTYWTPIFFLFLSRTIQKNHWRDSILTGLAFALIGYTRWQQLIPATITGLIYFGCTARHWLPKAECQTLVRLFVAGCVAVILISPAMVLLLSQMDSEGDLSDLMREGEEKLMETDLLAYITPSSSHPILGEHTQPLYDRYYSDRSSRRRFTAYVGFTPLLVAMVGVASKRWRRNLSWILMAITLVLLALGPLLRINGQFYPQVPMLYNALAPIGIIRLMRVPDRFNMFLALPVSVMMAYGTQHLLNHIRRPRPLAIFVAIVLSGLVLCEYIAIPTQLTPMPSFPPFYAHLAQESAEGAVLNMPFDQLKAKEYMFAQIAHEHPIVQGNLSRTPNDAYEYIEQNPLLHSLHQTNEVSWELSDLGRQLRTLAQDNIRYIIIHKQAVGSDRVLHWKRYLLIDPCYEDEDIAVYTTAPEANRDFELTKQLTPGLGPIKSIVSSTCVNPGHVLSIDIGWGSERPPTRDVEVILSLSSDQGIVHQTERFPLSTTWPTSQWHQNTIAWGMYEFVLDPFLLSGTYDIVLELADKETHALYGDRMILQSITVKPQGCNLATEPEAQDVNALFGDDLYLLEYQMNRHEKRLDVILYWQAQRHISTDYKIFVHIFEPATGKPVAQDDAIPHRGGYPTTFWWPGEIVYDRIPVYLEGAPSGTYGIAIGAYDPQTGQRLPLIDNHGKSATDGRLVLRETVTIE
jgi:hypothetical protein